MNSESIRLHVLPLVLLNLIRLTLLTDYIQTDFQGGCNKIIKAICWCSCLVIRDQSLSNDLWQWTCLCASIVRSETSVQHLMLLTDYYTSKCTVLAWTVFSWQIPMRSWVFLTRRSYLSDMSYMDCCNSFNLMLFWRLSEKPLVAPKYWQGLKIEPIYFLYWLFFTVECRI